jgi:hypothetical protein
MPEPAGSETMGKNKNKVFTNWDDTHSLLWGHQPIELAHQVHKSPLFYADALAELIERCPRAHYSLVQTRAGGSSRVWREGEIGDSQWPSGDGRDRARRALAEYARCRRGRSPLPRNAG